MKKTLICIVLLLLVVLTITSCALTGQGKAKVSSDKEAKQAVSDISNDLSNLSTSLDNINKQLG